MFAARGFQYQYLRTLEALFDAAETIDPDSEWQLFVEGGPTDDPASEMLDYSIVSNGVNLRLVQVKSTSSGGHLGMPAIVSIFARMIQTSATLYRIETNCTLTRAAKRLAHLLSTECWADDIEAFVVQQALSSLDLIPIESLRRCQIVFDGRSNYAVRDSINRSCKRLRGDSSLAGGTIANRLLMGYALSEIQDRATANPSRMITKREFRQWIDTPAIDLARAIQSFDSGVPFGRVPAQPLVTRDNEMLQIEGLLEPASETTTVRVVTLIGLSGTGKSSLAASWAHRHGHRYDFMIWIEAENEDAIADRLAPVLEWQKLPTDSAAQVITDPLGTFRTMLQGFPGRWLLVLDNVRRLHVVQGLIPPSGWGDVIVTSTNSADGWPVVGSVLEIGSMGLVESLDLLAGLAPDQLHLSSSEELAAAKVLVEGLSRWPLSLAMAGTYLRGTQVSVVAVLGYLDDLAAFAIGGEELTPPGYPRSLSAQILMAQTRIVGGSLPSADLANRLLLASSYLFANDIPVDLALRIAMGVADPHLSTQLLLKSAGGQVAVDLAIRRLREWSLVERYRIEDLRESRAPVDCLSFNEIVQRVVRTEFERRSDQSQLAQVLEPAVAHTSHAIAIARNKTDEGRLVVLWDHGFSVAEHAKRLAASSLSVALLGGNLANFFLERGNYDQVRELAAWELDILQFFLADSPVIHRAQALALKVQAGVGLNDAPESVLSDVELMVTEMLRLAPSEDGAGLLDLLRMIENYPGLRGERLTALIDKVVQHTGKEYGSSYVTSWTNLQSLLAEGVFDQAVLLARSCLEETPVPRQQSILLRIALAEALFGLGLSDPAFQILDETDALLAAENTFHSVALSFYGNLVGLAATRERHGGDSIAKRLLKARGAEATAISDFENLLGRVNRIAQHADGFDKYRLDLFEAVAARFRGNVDQLAAILNRMPPTEPADLGVRAGIGLSMLTEPLKEWLDQRQGERELLPDAPLANTRHMVFGTPDTDSKDSTFHGILLTAESDSLNHFSGICDYWLSANAVDKIMLLGRWIVLRSDSLHLRLEALNATVVLRFPEKLVAILRAAPPPPASIPWFFCETKTDTPIAATFLERGQINEFHQITIPISFTEGHSTLQSLRRGDTPQKP